MEIMELLLQICLSKTVTKGVNIKVFLVSGHSTRMLVLSMQSIPSCTWHTYLWCINLFIRLILGLIVLLGSFAIKHVSCIYNQYPNHKYRLIYLEFLTKTKADHSDMIYQHTWVCLLYVIDAKLKNDQKIAKWNWKSRLGPFLDLSDNNLFLVTNICHLKT